MVRAYLDSHWPYYCLSILIASYYPAVEWYGSYLYLLWVVYAIIPLLDTLIPLDEINPTEDEEKQLMRQIKWKFPLVVYLLTDWVSFFWAMHRSVTAEMTVFEFIVFGITIGHMGGLGILVSHEIMHKRDKVSRVVGTLNMSKNLYMHFFLEHIYGHHKDVATPLDPATARFNQTVYSFLPQSVFGGFAKSWQREKDLLTRKHKPVYGVSNRMLWFSLAYFLIPLGIYWKYGGKGVIFFVLQAFYGVFLLEVTNYLEHYGLQRKETAPGVYELVSIKHSWNAPQLIQNILLLKLQRHSDHHANSYKPYQTLSSFKESPNLPHGYAVCVLAALVPQVWFAIVNPLALQANELGKPSDRDMESAKFTLKAWVLAQALFFTSLLPFI